MFDGEVLGNFAPRCNLAFLIHLSISLFPESELKTVGKNSTPETFLFKNTLLKKKKKKCVVVN